MRNGAGSDCGAVESVGEIGDVVGFVGGVFREEGYEVPLVDEEEQQ